MSDWWEEYKKRNNIEEESRSSPRVTAKQGSGKTTSGSGAKGSGSKTSGAAKATVTSSTSSSDWWEDYKKRNNIEQEAKVASERASQRIAQREQNQKDYNAYRAAKAQLDARNLGRFAADTMRGVIGGNGLSAQGRDAERAVSRYERDFPLYQQMMEKGGYSPAIRQQVQSRAQQAYDEANDKVSAFNERQNQERQAYMDRLHEGDRGGYYAETLTRRQIDDQLRGINMQLNEAKKAVADPQVNHDLYQATPENYADNPSRLAYERVKRLEEQKAIYERARSLQIQDEMLETLNSYAPKGYLRADLKEKRNQGKARYEADQAAAKQSADAAFQAKLWEAVGEDRGVDARALRRDMQDAGYFFGVDEAQHLRTYDMDVFYALYAEDPARAKEWLQGISQYRTDANTAALQEAAGKNVLTQAGAMVGGTALRWASGVSNLVDPFGTTARELSRKGNALISGGAQGLNEWSGTVDENIPVLGEIFGGKGLGDLYSLGSSILESSATAAIAGGAGELTKVVSALGVIIMGSSAAVSDYDDSLRRGLTEEQATRHALAAGINEAAFEWISLDKLVNPGEYASWLKRWLTQKGIEASEEFCTSVANRISDGYNARRGGYDTQIEQRMKELLALGTGYDEAKEKATKEWYVELLTDAIGGWISGGADAAIVDGGRALLSLPVRAANDVAEIRNAAQQAHGTPQNIDLNQRALRPYMEQTGAEVSGSEAEALVRYAEDEGLQVSQGAKDAAKRLSEAEGGGQIARATETDPSTPLRSAQNDNGNTDSSTAAGASAQTPEQSAGVQSNDNEGKVSRKEARAQQRSYRELGAVGETVTRSIREKVDQRGLGSLQEVYDETVEKYGEGVKRFAQEAVRRAAAQAMSEATTVADLNQWAEAMTRNASQEVKAAVEQAKGPLELRLTVQDRVQKRSQPLDLKVSVKGREDSGSEIRGFSSDGKVVLANGETVAANQIEGDADTLDVVQTISTLGMSGDAANQMLQSYQQAVSSGEATRGYQWVMDYATAYDRGRIGSFDLRKAQANSRLDAATVKEAYELGQKAKAGRTGKGSETVQKALQRADTEGATGRRGTVDRSAIAGLTLSEDQETQLALGETIAAAFGIDVGVFASGTKEVEIGGETKEMYQGENGRYQDGKIWIDINAGRNFVEDVGSGILATMGHELTHWIQEYAPEEYEALQDFIVHRIVEARGERYLNRLIQDKINRARDNLSRDEALDEVVADACQEILSDSKAAQKLANENPTLLQKVLDWLHDFVDKVREALGSTPRLSEEAKLMRDLEARLRKTFGELWDTGIVKAAEVHDRVGSMEREKNTARESEQGKNSDRDTAYLELAKDPEKNRARLQEMVDEAAKRAGYTIKAYHGTKSGDFYVFDKSKIGDNYGGYNVSGGGFDFTTNERFANLWGRKAKGNGKVRVMPVYLKAEKTFYAYRPVPSELAEVLPEDLQIVDPETGEVFEGNEAIQKAMKRGADFQDALEENGVNFVNALQNHGFDSYAMHEDDENIAVYNEDQIKSADPVTYDDSGNVIPLSDRFNTKNQDIRFSMRDPVEQTDRLIAWHNMNEDALRSALELGGLAMPSWAIKTANKAHTSYGKISVIAPRELVDPKMNRNSMIFGGDAWTPVFPGVDYDVTYESAKKLEDEIKGLVGEETYNQIGGAALDHDNISSALSRTGGALPGHYSDSLLMKYAYLKSIGKDVTLPQTGERLDAFGYFSNEEVEQFVNRLVSGKLSLDRFRKMSTDELMQQEDLKAAMSQIREEHYREKLGNNEAFEKLKSHGFFSKDFTFSKVDAMLRAAELYFRNNGIKQTIDKRAAQEAIDKEINKADFEKWALNKLNSAVVKKGIRNDKDTFTPSGNRRSFDALHYAYNLANIVKAMKSQPKQGRTQFLSGPGSVKGAALKSYNTVDQVRKDRGRLVDSAEEGKAAYDAYNRNLEDILDRMSKNGDRFDAADALIEVFQHAKTEAAIYNYMQRELKDWYNISRELAHDAYELIGQINALPMEYFEGKTYDAVGFDETAAVVVPDDIDPALKQQLEDAGARVVEYTAGDDADRLAKVNSVEGAKFSERDYDNTLSDYDLIMGASDEGLVGDQKTQLKETKERISRVQALRNKLAETRAELKAAEKKIAELEKPGTGKFAQQMRAAKAEAQLDIERAQGKDRLNRAVRAERDKLNETRRELRKTETKLAKQIQREQDIITGKLKPLAMQRLLKAEREKAEKKVAEHKDEVFQNYKNRRRDTALRGRIRNLANELRRSMTNPTDRNYLPAHLAEHMTALLDSLDRIDEPRPGTQAADKHKATAEALRRLAETYNDISGEDVDPMYRTEYDDELWQNIKDLAKVFEAKEAEQGTAAGSLDGDRPGLRDLSSEELEQVYDLVKTIRDQMRQATKLLNSARWKSVQEAIQSVAAQQQSMTPFADVKPHEQKKRLRMLDNMSVMRAVEMMSGWDRNAALYQLMQGVEQGTVEAGTWVMEYNKAMQALKTGRNEKAYRQALTKAEDYGATDKTSGRAVKMTKLQAIQLYMTWQREANNDKLVHLQKGGATIRDAVAIQDGKGSKATSHTVRVTPELIATIEKRLTEWDRAYMKAVRDYLNREARETNKVLYQLKHRVLSTEDYYVPYIVDKGYLETKLEGSDVFNLFVKTPGSTQALQKRAPQPVIIDGMDTMMKKHVQDTANYVGLAIPIRDFAKVYNGRLAATEEGEVYTSIQKTIQENFQEKGTGLILQALLDVQGSTKGNSWNSQIAETLNKMQSMWVRTALMVNPSVTIKQAASYIAAESVLSHRALTAGNRPIFSGQDASNSPSLIAQIFATPEGKTAQRLYNEIDAHTSMHYMRRLGMSQAELADQALRSSPLRRRMNAIGASMEQSRAGHAVRKAGEALNPYSWIQRMDVATTAALWVACKEQAKLDGMTAGSQEYWQRTTELYERALRETQPMYDGLHRTANQKQHGGIMTFLFPFRTVPIQNHGQVAASYEALLASKGKSKAEQAKAGKFFVKTVWAQTESAFIFSLMTFIAAAMKRKTKKYRDEDEELTPWSLAKGFGADVASTWFSVLFPVFGSEMWNVGNRIYDKIEGSSGYTYDAFSVGVVDMLNDLASAGDKLFADAGKLMRGERVSIEDIGSHGLTMLLKGAKLAGLPADTIKTYAEGAIGNVKDLLAGRVPALNDESWERSAATNAKRYLKAWISGDLQKVDQVEAEMLRTYTDGGKSEEDASEALKTKLTSTAKDALLDGTLDEQDAIDFLAETGYYSEDEAWKKVQEWQAKAEHADEEDFSYSQYLDFFEGLDAGQTVQEAGKDYLAHGYTEEKLVSSATGHLRELYQAGEISEKEAIKRLKSYKGMDDNEAWLTIQKWDAMAEHEEDPEYNYSMYDELHQAISANQDASKIIKGLTDHGVKEENVVKDVKTYLQELYVEGNLTETAYKNYLSRYAKITKTDEVTGILNNAKCKKETGYTLDGLKEGYQEGGVSTEKVTQMLTKYKGMTASEAKARVRYWDYIGKNPDGALSEANLNTWYETKVNGKTLQEWKVPLETWESYKDQGRSVTGTDANGDGKTDPGSKKKEMLKLIDRLNLSNEQKDALYYYEGWAASTIWEAPWH